MAGKLAAVGLTIAVALTGLLPFGSGGAKKTYAAYEADWPELQAILENIAGVYDEPPGDVETEFFPDGPLLGNGDLGVVIGGDFERQQTE